MRLIIVLSLFLTSFILPTKREFYLMRFVPVAQQLQRETGIPASIQLAQALIESGGGQSYIAKNARNHFGIRWYKGTTKYEPFFDRKGNAWRCYNTSLDGWKDHAEFLCKHYESGIGKPYSYWRGFKGYGEKNYWKTIVKFIERHDLKKYDLF